MKSAHQRTYRWRDRHRETYRRIARKSNTKRRSEARVRILDFFHNRCASCGFDNPLALHIGHRHLREEPRLQSPELWKWIEAHPIEARRKYQLQCANCNCIQAHETGEFVTSRLES